MQTGDSVLYWDTVTVSAQSTGTEWEGVTGRTLLPLLPPAPARGPSSGTRARPWHEELVPRE